MSSEDKKRITKALSKQSKQFLLLFYFVFWFQGLSFKTQFEIEFRSTINAGQLVLE